MVINGGIGNMDEEDVNRILTQIKEDEPFLFLWWVHDHVCMVSCHKDKICERDEK